MKVLSCNLTQPQVEACEKTETRRIGWWDAEKDRPRVRPGEKLRIVRKSQGRLTGEPLSTIAIVEVLEVRREPLELIDHLACVAEGFPDLTPADFVAFFTKAQRCESAQPVTVIAWRYLLTYAEIRSLGWT